MLFGLFCVTVIDKTDAEEPNESMIAQLFEAKAQRVQNLHGTRLGLLMGC